MRELAFLNKGIKITFIDGSQRKKNLKFKFDGGVLEFVDFLDDKREKLKNKNGNDLFKKAIYIEGKKNNIEVECALKWNAGYSEDVSLTLITYLKKMVVPMFWDLEVH